MYEAKLLEKVACKRWLELENGWLVPVYHLHTCIWVYGVFKYIEFESVVEIITSRVYFEMCPFSKGKSMHIFVFVGGGYELFHLRRDLCFVKRCEE